MSLGARRRGIGALGQGRRVRSPRTRLRRGAGRFARRGQRGPRAPSPPRGTATPTAPTPTSRRPRSPQTRSVTGSRSRSPCRLRRHRQRHSRPRWPCRAERPGEAVAPRAGSRIPRVFPDVCYEVARHIRPARERSRSRHGTHVPPATDVPADRRNVPRRAGPAFYLRLRPRLDRVRDTRRCRPRGVGGLGCPVGPPRRGRLAARRPRPMTRTPRRSRTLEPGNIGDFSVAAWHSNTPPSAGT